MAFVSLKSNELLDLVSNPTHFHIDLSCVPAKADMDNLIVTA